LTKKESEYDIVIPYLKIKQVFDEIVRDKNFKEEYKELLPAELDEEGRL
jgi:hypothetical protein